MTSKRSDLGWQCLLFLLLMGLLFGPALAAQEPATEPPTGNSSETEEGTVQKPAAEDDAEAEHEEEPAEIVTEEVTITATFRETALMDTPLAITEVSTEELTERGAVDVETLYTSVPGLSYKTNSGATWNRITVRGLSPPSEAPYLSPTVAVYNDDASLTSAGGGLRQLAGSLFDLERVEVVKGPQGTLYGEAAMGGAIRYITAKPSLSGFGYRLNATYGDTEGGGNTQRVDGMLNIPLGSLAALRLVGFDRDDEGFYDTPTLGLEDYNDVRDRGGRGTLALFPTEKLSLRLSGYTVHTESDGPSVADGGPFINATLDTPELFNFGDDDTQLYTGTLDYVLPIMELVVTSSLLDREVLFTEETNERFTLITDATFRLLTNILIPGVIPPGRIFETVGGVWSGETDRQTHEVRLLSTTGDRLRWTAGAFYSNDDTQEMHFNEEATGTGTIAQRKYTPEKVPYAPFVDAILNRFGTPVERDSEELAAYGEVGYDLSDTWELVGGVRVAELSKQFDVAGASPASGDWEGTMVSPKVTAVWRPQPEAMYYGTIGTGYRPGGFNTGLVNTIATLRRIGRNDQADVLASYLEFDGDAIINYELGAKLFPARRTSLAVALYYMDWQDTLVEEDFFAVTGRSAFVVDAGEARSTGIEVEVSSQVTDRFRISFGGDYNDAVIEEDVTTGTSTVPAPAGNKLPNAPEYSFDIRLNYDVALPGEWTGNAAAGYAGVDDSFNRVTNEILTDGFETASARFGVRAPSDRWGMALTGYNLTDEAYSYECNEVGCRYARPRTVALEFTVSR